MPKSPSASSLMPAVKYRVSGLPFLPELPNSSAQSPSIESLPCFATRSVPRCSKRPFVLLLVGVDVPVAEVADEQVAAEAAERRRCQGEPPGALSCPCWATRREELPVEVVDIDEAEPSAVRLVVRAALLLRVRHEDPVADRLDPERPVVLRELGVDERAGVFTGFQLPSNTSTRLCPGP